jgi:uncharacterized membrane protein YccF (DUF307 family)
MTLHTQVSAAGRGVRAALYLAASVAFLDFCLYANALIGADQFIGLLKVVIVAAVAVAILGVPFAVAALRLRDRRLIRRRT